MARHINISSEYSSAKRLPNIFTTIPKLPAKPFKDIDFRSYQFTIVVIRHSDCHLAICTVSQTNVSAGDVSIYSELYMFRVYRNYQYRSLQLHYLPLRKRDRTGRPFRQK